MEFKKALKTLDLEKYEESIFKDDINGVLFEIKQSLIRLAGKKYKENWIKPIFERSVKITKETWNGSEGFLQYFIEVFDEQCCLSCILILDEDEKMDEME